MASKSKTAGRRRRATRKLKGGYYSFSGAVGTGAPNWTRGAEVPTPDYVKSGGRRRRVTKKGARRTRKHRGGSLYGATSASYQGTGARGIADFVAVDTKGPYVNGGAAKGAFNDFGAKPGSSF
jgi:hypothetical protein